MCVGRGREQGRGDEKAQQREDGGHFEREGDFVRDVVVERRGGMAFK